MYSLWNPTGSAQDILVTNLLRDGSGKYIVPVHLDAQASTMIDMAMLIAEIKPDADGNVIPPNIREGSATFSNAKARMKRSVSPLPQASTMFPRPLADPTAPTAAGDSNFAISPNPIFCPIGETMPCTATATDCYGSTFNQGASWYSSNAAVMTVDANGYVTGVSAGQATITANFNSVPTLHRRGVLLSLPHRLSPSQRRRHRHAKNIARRFQRHGHHGANDQCRRRPANRVVRVLYTAFRLYVQ